MLHAGTLLGGEVQTRACSHPPRPKKAREYGAKFGPIEQNNGDKA
jgi:hypothetical protein